VKPEPARRPKKSEGERKLRADVFDVPANTGKAQVIFDLWPLWRRGLRAEANVAWRDIHAGCALRTRILAPAEAVEPGIVASKERIGAQEQQMIRAQMAATIGSWLSNRQNDVRDAITRQFTPSRWGGAAKRRFKALPEDRRAAFEADLDALRHELYAINLQKAWMVPEGTAVMRTAGKAQVPVSDRARQLARTIFLGIAARHRWPRFQRLAMRLDERMGVGPQKARIWIEPADGGIFSWWLHVRPTGVKETVLLPIRGWGRERDDDRGTGMYRPGTLGKTVNVFVGDDGRLKAALTRDLTEVFATSRAAYHPLTEILSLDFGVRTLFASNHGDHLGRNVRDKIEAVADRADAEAARMQRTGRKPRDSALYAALVVRLRAIIDTEVNRVMNHAVARHRPRVLAVEKLDFRGSGLSRRMNRLLTNGGRGTVAKKLADLNARYGIEIHEVEPAYTSKTCSGCGYVDAKNRKTGSDKFHCCHCGRKLHADVNGARNIAASVSGAASGQQADHETAKGDGRSAPAGATSPPIGARPRKASSSPRTRSFTLRDIVRRFDERRGAFGAVSKSRRASKKVSPGARESASDPRLTNPYWKRHSALLKRKSDGPRNTVDAAFAVAT
jgi:putative transposase